MTLEVINESVFIIWSPPELVVSIYIVVFRLLLKINKVVILCLVSHWKGPYTLSVVFDYGDNWDLIDLVEIVFRRSIEDWKVNIVLIDCRLVIPLFSQPKRLSQVKVCSLFVFGIFAQIWIQTIAHESEFLTVSNNSISIFIKEALGHIKH